MSTTTAKSVSPAETPSTAEEVQARVEDLLPALRERAMATEQIRGIPAENLEGLTRAGVLKLTMPCDVGGYEADDYVVTEILAELARACPFTSWICTVMLALNCVPAMLDDGTADEIYATPDLRITGSIAPCGTAKRVTDGYQITGRWECNTGGVQSNWIAVSCRTSVKGGSAPIMALIPASATNHEASSVSAGMSGTAPSTVSVNDVFVPSPRTLPMRELTSGAFPQRRYTSNPYFNRPWMMWASAMGAAAVLGIARGAMQVFMEAFADGGPIAYTCWTKVAESPLLHHQLATAQFELEITEMYLERIRLMLQQTWAREATVLERVKTRAALGQITAHARTCVNVLFEACGASPTLPSGDIQRFFLQMNGIHQHIGIQPRSSDELYGRLLVGLKPDTDLY